MPPSISVIIPTYNRHETLRRTLNCLSYQEMPLDQFEVILVDNGSTDRTPQLAQENFPYHLRYLDYARETHQITQGPTQARNLGARYSQADTLAFLDDDICINPPALKLLTEYCLSAGKTTFLGSLVLPGEIVQNSVFARAFAEPPPPDDLQIHFTFCKTGLLAIRKEDFISLNGFQDPTGGWPNWDDVDFGYRAHRQGYRFVQCAYVIGEHWDYASLSLKAACQRLWRASKSAVRLLQVYPELRVELPMFQDALAGLTEVPLPWLENRGYGYQVARKLARRINASLVVLRSLEILSKGLEIIQPISHKHLVYLRSLYNWIIGGYIYRGFQEGLREYGPLNP